MIKAVYHDDASRAIFKSSGFTDYVQLACEVRAFAIFAISRCFPCLETNDHFFPDERRTEDVRSRLKSNFGMQSFLSTSYEHVWQRRRQKQRQRRDSSLELGTYLFYSLFFLRLSTSNRRSRDSVSITRETTVRENHPAIAARPPRLHDFIRARLIAVFFFLSPSFSSFFFLFFSFLFFKIT